MILTLPSSEILQAKEKEKVFLLFPGRLHAFCTSENQTWKLSSINTCQEEDPNKQAKPFDIKFTLRQFC